MIRSYKNSVKTSNMFTVIYVIFALAVFVPVHLLSEKRAARLESIGKENIYRKTFCITLRIILGAILYIIGVRLHGKSLFSISLRTSFRQILLNPASKILTIQQYACGFFPCLQQNYARKSAHTEILNRL